MTVKTAGRGAPVWLRILAVVAVSAREEDGDGSTPANNGATQAGAAYVFE